MSKVGNEIIRGLRELNRRLEQGDEIRGTRAKRVGAKLVFEQDVVVIPTPKRFRLEDMPVDKKSSSAVLRILDALRDLTPEAVASFQATYIEHELKQPADCNHADKDQRTHTNHQRALQRDRALTYKTVLEPLLNASKVLKAEVRRRKRSKCPCCVAHQKKTKQ